MSGVVTKGMKSPLGAGRHEANGLVPAVEANRPRAAWHQRSLSGRESQTAGTREVGRLNPPPEKGAIRGTSWILTMTGAGKKQQFC